MDAKEVLIAARAKIENPENWWDGRSDECRTKLCALGAIGLVAGNDNVLFNKACAILTDACGCAPQRYNDTHDHGDMLMMFDRAVAAADH